MAKALTPTTGTLRDLQAVAERAQEYAKKAVAANTRRAYKSDWDHFSAWCHDKGLEPLPAAPETVGLYLAACAESLKVSTLRRRLATISQLHRIEGKPLDTRHPAIRLTLRGIARAHGAAQKGAAPLIVAELRRICKVLPDTTIGIRDRSLLLTGFAGALRRSELVALDWADIETNADGLILTLRASKTDVEGEGERLGIPFGSHLETCPVRSLGACQDASRMNEKAEGPVYRPVRRGGAIMGRLSGDAIASIIKKRVAEIDLDPRQYSGHSLRSGLATSAAAAGVAERVIMKQTRHASLTTLAPYIREGSLFLNNAAASVGL